MVNPIRPQFKPPTMTRIRETQSIADIPISHTNLPMFFLLVLQVVCFEGSEIMQAALQMDALGLRPLANRTFGGAYLFCPERSSVNDLALFLEGGRNVAERLEVLDGLLKAVSRGLLEVIKDASHQHGFPGHGMPIMHEVVEIPGTTVSELARRTGIAKSHVSNTVETLTQMGFLEKRPDPSDQRRVCVYATEQAKTHFQQMQGEVRRRLSAVISTLPDGKMDAAIDGLQVLKAALEQQKTRSTSSGE